MRSARLCQRTRRCLPQPASHPGRCSSQFPLPYDPKVMQLNAAHVEEIGPPELEILQCPRTASSGRRLIVTSAGGSYTFLASFGLGSSFIRTPFSLAHFFSGRRSFHNRQLHSS